MRIWLLLALLLATFVSGPAATAQAYGTDMFVGGIAGDIIRVTPAGVVTTVITGAGRFFNMITMDNDNQMVIGIDSLNTTAPNRVLRIDPVSQAVVATVWSGAPLTSGMNYLRVDQDGDYLIADGGTIYKLKPDGSAISIYYNNGAAVYDSFTEDKLSGDWILGDRGASPIMVHHVNRNSLTLTTMVSLGTSWPTAMEQDPHRPEIYIGGGSPTVRSYSPLTKTVGSVVNDANNANSLTVDRAPGSKGELIYIGTSRPAGDLVRYDRSGTNLGIVANILPARFLGMTFDQSRNLAPALINAPNDRNIRVSFPGDGGKGYVLAISLAGCQPGVTLGDGRVIPIVPDLFTVLTVQGPLGNILTGNVGVLGSNGSAFARLDANPLGKAATGIRVWAAAVSLGGPTGISQISHPLLFVLN